MPAPAIAKNRSAAAVLRCWLAVAALLLLPAGAALAQQEPRGQLDESVRADPSGDDGDAGITIDGPPPPLAPEVISRDAQGRVTVRAVRLPEGLVVDGNLDEPAYARVPGLTGFIQQEPNEGAPATEKTEAWIFFDDENIYVAARNWDSQPERMVVNEMRRDNRGIQQNENFTVVLDTFYDRRNGFIFQTNPLGALADGLITDERDNNTDWNTVWDVKTQRFDQGWTVEIVIPFKSLRYNAGRQQVWGVNLRREVRWKNERAYLSPVPASYSFRGLMRISSAATLVGVEVPAVLSSLELKPYAISSVTTNTVADPAFSNDLAGDVGFDVKYGLTDGLTADFTVNTDFAQVEDDEAQVNLTRFSLFFPEKREFFLEGQGIFAFGGAGARRFGSFGGGGLTPIMFFSRRIGLDSSIRGGGRVTGRAGKFTMGLLNIQTGQNLDDLNDPVRSTNFSVVRLRRDILRRSNVGIIGTSRSVGLDGAGSSQTFGADGNFSFLQNLELNTYYAETSNPGSAERNASYRARMQNNGDRYGITLEHLTVEDDFNPELGFLRRRNFRRNFAQLQFSPRPRSIQAIRKFSFQGRVNYIENATTGQLETRELNGQFQIQFENSDWFVVNVTDTFEFLPEAFEISDGVTLPVGGYDFREMDATYFIGRQRRVNGRITVGTGSFFGGDRTSVAYGGRVEFSPQFAIEPNLQINLVDLPQGSFTTSLASARVTYTLTPRSFVGALMQYSSSSDSVSTNIRYRWEYQPGSDIFFVYSEGRGTDVRGFPTLENRGFVVKFTKLLRF